MKTGPAISPPRRRADERRASARARSWIRGLLAERAPALFLYMWEPTHAELGRIGETLAARHLSARGFRVFARRLSTPCGELDLVARRDGLLLGVEVKSARVRSGIRPRGSDSLAGPDLRWRPGLRWHRRQARRGRRALRWLCSRTPWASASRLELIEVFVGPPHRFYCAATGNDLGRGDGERAERGPIY